VDRLRQPQPRKHGCDDGDGGRRPDRGGIADLRKQTAERRTDDEAEAERGAKDAEHLRAVLVGRDVADVGTGGRNVATGKAVHDARGKQHQQALRHSQHYEADHRADEAENQDRTPPPLVGPGAEHRRRDELGDGERREQQANRQRRRAERLRVERQQRDDDPEANEVDKDR
jgi:hypothetical protein